MEKFIKSSYEAIGKRIPEEEFNKLFAALEKTGQKSFARACFMYQRAMKCRGCDSDIAIALMCSSIESVSGGKTVIFKDWLLKQDLTNITKQDEKHVRAFINKAYDDYMLSDDRDGISYNFMKFMLKYCPKELRTPPIIVYKGAGDPFNILVRGLYSNFRSLFLHGGIGYASLVDKPYIDDETGEPITMIAIPLLLKMGGKVVSVELTKLVPWFSEVVLCSLVNYLRNPQ